MKIIRENVTKSSNTALLREISLKRALFPLPREEKKTKKTLLAKKNGEGGHSGQKLNILNNHNDKETKKQCVPSMLSS